MMKMLFLALAAFASGVSNPMPPNLQATERFYIGTYTSHTGSEGIYSATLNPASGALSSPILAAPAVNPSYLAFRPGEHFLYAVDESDRGSVGAFSVVPGGALEPLGYQALQGSAPCHLSVDPTGHRLYVACYIGGVVQSLPILGDGSLGASVGTFMYSGRGPNRERQEASHMHWVHQDPTGQFLYSCDLGADLVRIDRLGDRPQPENSPGLNASVPAGAGPRHGAWARNGRFFYANNEMGNSVCAFAVVGRSGRLSLLQTIGTLPEGAHSVGTAEIEIHPSGRYLYVSNRGHDSIAVFAIGAEGKLDRIQVAPAGVKTPRGFGIDPTGRWLVAAGQDSHDLVSLAIDPATGRLGEPAHRVTVGAPVCILFARE